MTEDSKWRFEIAEQIAASYAQNPKVRVIMVAGSTGRGVADRYSDLEVDVYYDAPPTKDERIAMARGAGGEDVELAEDEIEWEEQFYMNGFHVATSTFLVSTMERFLDLTIDRCEVDEDAQMRLHSVLHSNALVGDDLVNRWRERAKAYPDGLMHAMLAENLQFRGFGYAEDMFAARDDALALYEIFVRIGQQMMCALMGLNRMYLPMPSGLKWMDESIGVMAVKPVNLSARMKQTFRMDLVDGLAELKALIDEVMDLVDEYGFGFDTRPYRKQLKKRRQVWDRLPDHKA